MYGFCRDFESGNIIDHFTILNLESEAIILAIASILKTTGTDWKPFFQVQFNSVFIWARCFLLDAGVNTLAGR